MAKPDVIKDAKRNGFAGVVLQTVGAADGVIDIVMNKFTLEVCV